MGFSVAQFHLRTQLFTQFLATQGLRSLPVADWSTEGYRMRQAFLVYNQASKELAKVALHYQRGFSLTAPEGPLKTCLATWSTLQGDRLYDHASQDDLSRLETYRSRFLPPPSPTAAETLAASTRVRLRPTDHPLIELAELLGYTVSLTTGTTPPFPPLYLISDHTGCVATGEHLVTILADLLTARRSSSEEHRSRECCFQVGSSSPEKTRDSQLNKSTPSHTRSPSSKTVSVAASPPSGPRCRHPSVYSNITKREDF